MKVKTVKKYFLKSDHDKVLVSRVEMDEHGKVVSETRYNENGMQESQTIISYNEKGHPLSEITTGDDEYERSVTEFEYYENGQLKQKRNVYSDNTFEHDDFCYEENCVITKSFDAEEVLLHARKTFSENGKIVASEIADEGDNLLESHTITYNEKGDSVKETALFCIENKLYAEETNYDSDGNVISETAKFFFGDEETVTEDENLLAEKTETIFNNNLPVERNHENYLNSAGNRSEKWAYNENGILTRHEMFGPNGELISSYSYETDANGMIIHEKKVYSATYLNEYGGGLSPIQLFEYEREYFN